MTSTSPQLAAALRYAAAGWPVFACQPGSKVPPEGSRGFKDATTDPDKVAWLWRRTGQGANVAIATGAPGPDVLDVDVHDGAPGWQSYGELRLAGLVPDAMAEIRTPSGGGHFYYQGTGQRIAKLPARGIDYRGAGGYVVAPPSQVDGRPYVVVSRQASPAAFDWNAAREHLDPQPQAKAIEHHQPTRRPGSLDHLARYVADLQPGNRNDGFFWAACRAAEAADRDALDAIAESARAIGLSEREITASLRSAERTAASQHDPLTEARPFAAVAKRQAEAGA
jgi:hypothetical protein